MNLQRLKYLKRVAVGTALASLCLATPISGAEASVPGLSFTETGCEGYSDSVARLYSAGLGREPDAGGFGFWMGQYKSGAHNLQSMSDFFVVSSEFDSKYGALDQTGFLNQIYLNVLNRPADTGGLVHWGGQMNAGMTRGRVLLSFVESPENVTRSGTSEPTLGLYNLGRQGPWTCIPTFVPQPVVDPAGPVIEQPVFVPEPVVATPDPVIEQPVFVPQPVATPPVVVPANPVVDQPFPPGNPGNSHNCSDFKTQSEAQAWFDHYFPRYGDVSKLDRDKDGRVCESLR